MSEPATTHTPPTHLEVLAERFGVPDVVPLDYAGAALTTLRAHMVAALHALAAFFVGHPDNVPTPESLTFHAYVDLPTLEHLAAEHGAKIYGARPQFHLDLEVPGIRAQMIVSVPGPERPL